MLAQVVIGRPCCAPFTNLNNDRTLVGDELIDEIVGLARDLDGARVCHLNATAYGGGVAELLARLVPLALALGIRAEWRLVHGSPKFFAVTKALHNALQGGAHEFPAADRELYLEVNRRTAELLGREYDVVVVHDPQPAPVRRFAPRRGAKWIWRCHIDTSQPNPDTAAFFFPYVQDYDTVVFTLREFMPPGLALRHAEFIPPAIDPLSTKNLDLPADLHRAVVADAGVSLEAPMLLQVSRFDPWKDPMGVVEAYRRVKREIPRVQMVFVGAMAGDDPQGWNLLAQLEKEAAKDPTLFVLTNLSGVGSMEVNAFQRTADVVIQKSLREGFGLVVSEAFWKGRPVVAGRAGGIPMQFPPGHEGWLVDSVEECADRVVRLLKHPDEAGRFAAAAREHVRKNFLLPRLLRDELRVIRAVLRG